MCRRFQQILTELHSDPFPLCTVLRFEADVEKFVGEGGEKDLTFDANLTGYQVVC